MKHFSLLIVFLLVYPLFICKGNVNSKITLDQHLKNSGFTLSPAHTKNNEGYASNAQLQQFRKKLQSYQNIENIAEIGLNAGHSTENFFQACPHLKKFVSFDINQHAYTKVALEYLTAKYQNRFIFMQGDSHVKVPEFARLFPQQKFDLIYIDGDHSYEGARVDIEQCKLLAHKNTFLWIDDGTDKNVAKAIKRCRKRGYIEVIATHISYDQHGSRNWVEARYIIK